jgi:hypothetical protein
LQKQGFCEWKHPTVKSIDGEFLHTAPVAQTVLGPNAARRAGQKKIKSIKFNLLFLILLAKSSTADTLGRGFMNVDLFYKIAQTANVQKQKKPYFLFKFKILFFLVSDLHILRLITWKFSMEQAHENV